MEEMNTLISRNSNVRYKYSKKSLEKLIGVHPKMVDFALALANIIDCTLVYGVRTDQEQHQLFLDKKSSKDGYEKRSKHQIDLVTKFGHALDILPRPRGVNMYLDDGVEDDLRWAQFDGACHAIAFNLGIKVRTGFKWRSNLMDSLARDERDNTFPDGNHVELVL